MPAVAVLDTGNPDSDDESRKADKLAARAARFSNKLPGNRYKQLEERRAQERKAFEDQGLLKTGKIELDEAVDMRGTCERMCSDYEREFREYTREVHPFESAPNKRMDPDKAVAAYSRSDAGAGHGDSAVLPSDLRTPITLVGTLDYLFAEIMPIQPPSSSDRPPSARKALGHSVGFIRDRTRAIRKEFAMQSSWGHVEAIASFERIARWHILCLRELQEETGTNSDMHIDSAELGRCFTSLRQHYNDRREELGVETPCQNEPEFRAYMLIFDLANKSVSIPCAELPPVILDHPLVKLAWQIRKAAQRNFDSQKEGSKLNAELGANLITSFVRLLRQERVPYLMACLVEIRLRDMRRSALRALMRAYPRLRSDAIRLNEAGEVVERKMLLFSALDKILGCEEQEMEEAAYDDVDGLSKRPVDEAVSIVTKSEIHVYEDKFGPAGAMVNLGAPFNDNRDAPYTRRWRSVTEKRSDASFVDVVNGEAGIFVDGTSPPAQTSLLSRMPPSGTSASKSLFSFTPTTMAVASSRANVPQSAFPKPALSFSFDTAPTATSQTATTGFRKPEESSSFTISDLPVPHPKPSASPTMPSLPPTAPSNQSFALAPRPEDSPASATLFSKPAFFSGLPTAGPSAITVKLPTPSRVITQPAQVPQLPDQVSPNSRSKKSAKSVASKSPAAIEVERQKFRRALPFLTDRLIGEVISGSFEEITSELLKTVKQEAAARTYAKAKCRRKRDIRRWSEWTFDVLRKEAIVEIATQAMMRELRRRVLVRRTVCYWRDWARMTGEAREEAVHRREETFDRLRMMGLGEYPLVEDGLKHEAGPAFVHPGGRLDEFEVDVALHQAQRTKCHFFSPATFLAAIARRVSPLLSPLVTFATSRSSDQPERPGRTAWHTVLSLANTSAPTQGVEDWLIAKFTSRTGEVYEQDGVSFVTTVVNRYDELPSSVDIGLIVFMAPPKTWDSRKATEDIADAQDRMATFAKAFTTLNNRFIPALLILTWEDQSLEEVLERLDVQDDVAFFQHRAVLSLEYSDDLDVRFEKALQEIVPEIPQKAQLVIHLSDALDRLHPSWQRFLEISSFVLAQRPTNAATALKIFGAGLEAINEIPRIIRSGFGQIGVKLASPFKPIILPAFATHSASSLNYVVEVVIDYLSKDIFLGLDDLSLLITPLRQAALRASTLPLVPILRALAFLVLGEISAQTLFLRAWTLGSHNETLERYVDVVTLEYQQIIDDRIAAITVSPQSPVLRRSPIKPSLKRSRISDVPPPSATESKAEKNARLKLMMEEVNRTIGQMGNGGLGSSASFVV